MKKVKFSKEVASEQWQLFIDEYDLPDDESEIDGDTQRNNKFKEMKSAMIRAIMAGHIEIVEDVHEGIVVHQFIAHPVEGIPGGDEFLTYGAPTVAHVSQAGVGKSQESSSQMRCMRVAAALTNKSEPIMCRLKGGDRARMELISSLFLLA